MKIKLILAAVIFFVFLGMQIPQFFSQKSRFIFCNVGEGDGALLITRENVFLIDAGLDNRMAECLNRHLPFWRREITGVILTHPDADHINGLNSVIKSYKVKWLFSNFTASAQSDYSKILDTLRNSGVIVKSFVAGEKIRVNFSENSESSENSDNSVCQRIRKSENRNVGKKSGSDVSESFLSFLKNPGSSGIEITSLWPLNSHHEYESTNLFSTVSVVTIGESRFLMLGDSEIATQIELMPEIEKIQNSNYVVVETRDRASRAEAQNAVGVVNMNTNIVSDRETHNSASLQNTNNWMAVKLSHHGSVKNFSFTFLREANPKYAIISVGANKYGHPGKKVIELLNLLTFNSSDVSRYPTVETLHATSLPEIDNVNPKINKTQRVEEILRTDQTGDIIFECGKACELKN